MRPVLTLLFLAWALYAQGVTVYYNLPGEVPSSQPDSPIGQVLMEQISSARTSIDFAIYGIRDQEPVITALIDAQNRGVRIRGVVDKDTQNRNYYACTERLYEHFAIEDDFGRSASYLMHHKFFVFDNQRVLTGSANISDRGTGGYHANIAALVDHPKVASLYTGEFEQMFSGRFHRQKSMVRAPHPIEVGTKSVTVIFMPNGPPLQESLVALIKEAQETIRVSIFFLTHPHVINALIGAQHRGVDVRIILDTMAARHPAVPTGALKESGLMVKVESWRSKMHMKALSVDGHILVLGSMNFTAAAENGNDENFMIIHSQKLAAEFGQVFERLWQSLPPQNHPPQEARPAHE